MSKVKNINIRKKHQQKEPLKLVELADAPDGEYQLIPTGKAAVKYGDLLDVYDLYTMIGCGVKVKTALFVREK